MSGNSNIGKLKYWNSWSDEALDWGVPQGHCGTLLVDCTGVRVIYFNKRANGEIWLLLIYAKNISDNIPAHVLREIREEIEND